MVRLNTQQREVIRRSQQSVSWFLDNFGKLKHTSAGVLPFHPFSYQKHAIKCFRKHRLNIFRKCRQCFPGDQMVWGPHGPKRMDTIKPGDLVYSFNPQTKRMDTVPVLEVFDNGEREVCDVRTKTGHTSSSTLDHHYFTYDGPKAACDLITDDHLFEISENAEGVFLDPEKGAVKDVRIRGRVEKVYDLRVPPYDNYVVDGAVVHNSGISKISGAFATWFAMFHPHKTVLIVSRRNEDAMGFLRDHVVFLYEHLPPWMKDVWKPVKQNEHEIIFPNGSRIQSLTSHPEVLRGNSASLNIIDEAAFIQGMGAMWAAGWPCQIGNTLIQTDEGLQKIESFDKNGDEWQDLNLSVATDTGYRRCDKLHVPNGGTLAPTIKLTTELGFTNEGTPHHRLRTIDEFGNYAWKELQDFEKGDLLVSKPDEFVGKRRFLSSGLELDEDLAELIGLYVGDGSLYDSRPKRFKIHFDPQDAATVNYAIDQLNKILYKINNPTIAYSEVGHHTINLRLNSAPFVGLLCENGLKSKTCPQDAEIPSIILGSDRAVICAFLRGLFDSDGWCYQSSTCLKLGMSSQSEELIRQVQVTLHALGIISKISRPKNHKDRWGKERAWRLDVLDGKSKQLFKEIGFITERKQHCLDLHTSNNDICMIDHPALLREFLDEIHEVILNLDKSELRAKLLNNFYGWRRKQRVLLSAVEEVSELFQLNNNLSKMVLSGYFFDKVKTKKNKTAKVFDLSVPDNNTYLANGFVSHNTLQHGGNVISISTCVAPDTLVNTLNGLYEIQDLAPQNFDGFDEGYYHSDYIGPDIVGINGLENATKIYKRPTEATKIISTTCGYKLEASHRHKLLAVDSSTGEVVKKFVHELKIGDFLPVKAGQMVFGNNDYLGYSDPDRRFTRPDDKKFEVERIDGDLAYLLGVIIAEGHIRDEEVVLSCGDPEVLDRCESWRDLGWNRGRKDQDYITVSRPMFVRFLQFLGVELTTASFKTIPKRLLQCSEPIIREFLKGLFDGDGFAAKRDGQPGLCSTSYKLIKQVRMLLFNYGIHTCLEISPPGTTTFLRDSGERTVHETLQSYKLIISSNFIELFYDLIGFDLDRKQCRRENKTANWSELMPPVVRSLLKGLKDSTDLSVSKMTSLGLAPNVLFGSMSRITKRRLSSFMDQIDYSGNEYYDKLQDLLKYDWFNCVKNLEDSENEVYDFTLPTTHTFIGDCFININTNGLGGWYWSTWTDAEAGVNGFNPILINWWDMDWQIEYQDPLSMEWKRIAPRDGIRKCTTKEDINKYGQYWSPWLEEQYNALQDQGESWRFDQEILASFIGSGNTVLPKEVLAHVQTTIKDPIQKITGYQTYVHPVSGNIEELSFNFSTPEEGLWIWEKPVVASAVKRRDGVIIDPGRRAHSYVMGIDIATGKGKDYSTIEILDIDAMEQVAEFMARCLPREFIKYIDRIGRWYNSALAVIERNNGGDIVIDNMRHDMMYPRIWRKKDINDKPQIAGRSSSQRALKVQQYGFSTSSASKPVLNKYLLDNIRDTEDSYTLYSTRLLKQLQTYVRKRDRVGRDTNKTEAEEGAGNFDDLVIGLALGLIGANDAFSVDAGNMIPMNGNMDFSSQTGPTIYTDGEQVDRQKLFIEQGGASLLMPMALAPDEFPDMSAQRHIDSYTIQLGGIPMSAGGPIVTPQKYFYTKDK